MLDVLMIVMTAGFFAACLAYMVGCERLDRQPAVVSSQGPKDLVQKPQTFAEHKIPR